MKEKQKKESEVIFREKDAILYLEIKLSKKLEKEMRKLTERTAGTITA